MDHPLKTYVDNSDDTFSSIAKRIGCSPSLISHIAAGRKTCMAEMAVSIERETGGRVSRAQLRPDLWPGAVAGVVHDEAQVVGHGSASPPPSAGSRPIVSS